MDKTITHDQYKEYKKYKEYYQTLCEIYPIGLFRTDNNGNIVYINKKYEQMLGSTSNKLKNDGWITYIYDKDTSMVLTEWQKCIQKRLKFTLEFRIKKSNGKIIWILGQIIPVNSKNGFVGTITNINKRKKILNEFIELKELK